MKQFVSEYKGYKIEFLHISYMCERLKLYGYTSERQVKNAIDKKLKKGT